MNHSNDELNLFCTTCEHELRAHDRVNPWPCTNVDCNCVAFRVDKSKFTMPTPEQISAFYDEITCIPASMWEIVPIPFSQDSFTCILKTTQKSGPDHIHIGPAYGSFNEIQTWLDIHHPGWASMSPDPDNGD